MDRDIRNVYLLIIKGKKGKVKKLKDIFEIIEGYGELRETLNIASQSFIKKYQGGL